MRAAGRNHLVRSGTVALAAFLLILGLSIGGPIVALREASLKQDAEQQRQVAEAETQRAESEQAKAVESANEAQRQKETAQRLLYAARLDAAKRAFDAGRLDQTLGVLKTMLPDSGEKDLRGWEWYYLNRQCHPALRTIQLSAGEPTATALSPDGRTIAVAFATGDIEFWDFESGTRLAQLTSASKKVKQVAFSPDSSRFATGDDDGGVEVWDVEKAAALWRKASHREAVTQLAFSSDGATLASGGKDRGICIWNVQSGDQLATLREDFGTVASLDFDAAANRLVSLSERLRSASGNELNGRLAVWDLKEFKLQGSIEVDLRYRKQGKVFFGRSGGMVFAAASGGSGTSDGRMYASVDVSIYRIDEQGKLLPFSVASRGAAAQEEASLAREFDAPARDSLVQIVEGRHVFGPADSGRSLGNYYSDSGPNNASPRFYLGLSRVFPSSVGELALVARHGDRAAAISKDRTIYCLDKIHSSSSFSYTAVAISATADWARGRLFLIPSWYQSTIRVVDGMHGDTILQFNNPRRMSTPLEISSRASLLAFGTDDGRLCIVNSDSGIEQASLEVHRGTVTAICLSDDNRFLVSGGEDGCVQIVDFEKRSVVRTIQSPHGDVTSVRVSPDGQRLVYGHQSGSLVQSSMHSDEPAVELGKFAAAITCLDFSRDGKLLAAGVQDGKIHVWEVSSNKPPRNFDGHVAAVTDVAFVPGQSRLASFGADGKLRIWDVTAGVELMSLSGRADAYSRGQRGRSLAFAPDGQRLVWVNAMTQFMDVSEEDEDARMARFVSGELCAREGDFERVKAGLEQRRNWNDQMRSHAVAYARLRALSTEQQYYRCLSVIRDASAIRLATSLRQRDPDNREYQRLMALSYCTAGQASEALPLVATGAAARERVEMELRTAVLLELGQLEEAVRIAGDVQEFPSAVDSERRTAELTAIRTSIAMSLAKIVREAKQTKESTSPASPALDEVILKFLWVPDLPTDVLLTSFGTLTQNHRWADMARAVRAGGDENPRGTALSDWNLAMLELAAGNQKTYVALCQKMLDQFATDRSPDTRFIVAFACILGPDATKTPERIVALAEDVAMLEKWHPGKRTVQGAALFRAGRLAEAKKLLEQALTMHGFARTIAKERAVEILISELWCRMYLTLTYFGLDEHQKAGKSLESLDQVITQMGALPKQNATASVGYFYPWIPPCMVEIVKVQVASLREQLGVPAPEQTAPRQPDAPVAPQQPQ